jgi:hypothetical protein
MFPAKRPPRFIPAPKPSKLNRYLVFMSQILSLWRSALYDRKATALGLRSVDPGLVRKCLNLSRPGRLALRRPLSLSLHRSLLQGRRISRWSRPIRFQYVEACTQYGYGWIRYPGTAFCVKLKKSPGREAGAFRQKG